MPPLLGLKVTYRCLDNVELDFTSPEDGKPSPFIALVGANGTGKTTVLDAIARTVYSALRELPNVRPDLVSMAPVQLQFERNTLGTHPSTRLDWTVSATTGEQMRPELERTLYVPSGYLPILPVNVALAVGPKQGLPREDALLLQNPVRRVNAVHQWWLHQHWEYPRTSNLDRLWQALQPFLGDRVYAGVNPDDHLPRFDAAGTQVSFNELSSGERRIVLLFMEIAMQCGDDGLLLFDEPEAHFHPEWQRMLREALQRLVPRGQIIVATHSPFIIDDMPPHQLFVFGDLPW